MLPKPSVIASLCAAIMVGTTAWSVFAQPADKRTIFTFNVPVAVPGVTLPSGAYLFRVADSSSRNVVQVLSADGKKPLAQFFAMRATRDLPAKGPEVRFMETGQGMPAAIRTWWYPGERTGYEFVYPKDQARRLAMNAQEPVLTTQADTTSAQQTGTGDLVRISRTGDQTTAGDGSVASAPIGTSHAGEVAPQALVIAVFAQ